MAKIILGGLDFFGGGGATKDGFIDGGNLVSKLRKLTADALGEHLRLVVGEVGVEHPQRLNRAMIDRSNWGGGIGIGTVESFEIRLFPDALLDEVDAPPEGGIIGKKLVVLGKFPSDFLGKRVRSSRCGIEVSSKKEQGIAELFSAQSASIKVREKLVIDVLC